MKKTAQVLAVLFVVNGGWMAFDGGRALLVGDYVRPQSGEYAGKLGPWAQLVSSVGLLPESAIVKVFMAVCGAAAVAAGIAFLAACRRARGLLAAAAVAVLWYLPFGTVAGAALIVVLIRTARSD